MFIGPVFSREVALAPRRPRIYAARAAYGLVLLVLMSTAWLILTGTQVIRDIGDLARFGMALFQVLAPLQLAVAIFFSALLAASAVSQEKDRHTLDLLLLTKLTNSELVLGKLLAALLNMTVLLATAFPVFMIAALFGGVSFGQIGRIFAVTAASVLVCGSLGSILALWREKTFQALALTMLILILWLAGWRVVSLGMLGSHWLGLPTDTWAIAFSPLEAIFEASRPYIEADPALGFLGTPANLFLAVALGTAALLNGTAIAMVRVWNPSREAQTFRREDETWRRASIWSPAENAELPLSAVPNVAETFPSATQPESAPAGTRTKSVGQGRTREVWDNPVIWREIVTWAYGRKVLVIRITYLLLFALAFAAVASMVAGGQPMTRAAGATVLAPLFLLSLVLVNAQAVTSMTSERDGKALDLLLVSDLTPKEIVFGKLGGVFYNTKEMVALPILLCGYLCWAGPLSFENMLYLAGGLVVLCLFVAMLGIHAGMHYVNSRSAIATSLGTVFFLFLGVATCMWMMVAFSGSFEGQLPPFLAFMIGGGLGLYVALGARNPSTAIGLASFLCPFATFYAITSFFLNYTLGVFLVTAAAYGFATAAMLVPAVYEFDVATGRTTVGE
jgi:ABC-type transport system involved in multi-copper enzyme maturation permease subunit